MATDALDPGPNGDYPYLDPTLQPTGMQQHKRDRDRLGCPVLIDVTLRLPDGRPATDLLADPDPQP